MRRAAVGRRTGADGERKVMGLPMRGTPFVYGRKPLTGDAVTARPVSELDDARVCGASGHLEQADGRARAVARTDG